MVKIMVVDDNREDLDTMKTLLEKAKYKVMIFSNGNKALENLNDDFDLVLIDIKMPPRSGYDLLKLMREKIGHKVKIVYVSVVPEKDAFLEDSDGFIQKPFDLDGFLQEVKKVLNLKK